MAEFHRQPALTSVALRDPLREEINKQIERFLNSGGRIEVVGGPQQAGQQPARYGVWRELGDSVIGLN